MFQSLCGNYFAMQYGQKTIYAPNVAVNNEHAICKDTKLMLEQYHIL